MQAELLVIAKAPVPGRSKTRLCPPCTFEQAAAIAEASLVDTLLAVERTPCGARRLVLEGAPAEWLPEGFEVVPQVEGGLDLRLAAAFAACAGPALLVGMDTPQISPELLGACLDELAEPGVDAVLGPAEDGGYWAIGLNEPDPRAFLGIPMSTAITGDLQRRRLLELDLVVRELPTLRDVDRIEDAWAVASECGYGGFAAAVERTELSLA